MLGQLFELSVQFFFYISQSYLCFALLPVYYLVNKVLTTYI